MAHTPHQTHGQYNTCAHVEREREREEGEGMVLLLSLYIIFRSVFLNGPGLMIFTTLCAMSGGTIFGWYYYVGCDPLEAGYIDNSNQVKYQHNEQ